MFVYIIYIYIYIYIYMSNVSKFEKRGELEQKISCVGTQIQAPIQTLKGLKWTNLAMLWMFDIHKTLES